MQGATKLKTVSSQSINIYSIFDVKTYKEETRNENKLT